ncbi:MAG: hypothetical protein ACD_45C00694G0001 [uncultured bacterium]|nr:MAG: hypothetical protein ACD_45C00694G0001 [uncultured bacterium]
MSAKNNIDSGVINQAILRNYLETVRFLYEQGQRTSENETYLSGIYIAAGLGYTKILKYLIEKGETVKINKIGETPLMYAAGNGNIDCLKLLLTHPNIKYVDNRSCENKTLSKSEFINLCSNKGNTALHLAAKSGNVAAIKFLIMQGADIESKNNNDETPLDLAIASNHKSAIGFITNQLKKLKQPKNDRPETNAKSKNDESSFVTNDPHSILGVSKDDSSEKIRKAYYKKMREYHPDKANKRVANANEIAKMINWAYNILKDENERKKWEASQSDTENNTTLNFQVPTSSERPSASYKRSFEKLETLFQSWPLKQLSKEKKKSAFDKLNDLSKNKLFGDERYQHLFYVKDKGIDYPDVYQYIQHLAKESAQLSSLDINLNENLTNRIAIDFLLRFLAGEFYGNNLTAIQDYLQVKITQLNKHDPNIAFYRSIQTIINVTCVEKEYQKILDSLQGIYSFAYQPNSNNADIVRLMQNKYFRYLVADAHRYFWRDDSPLINKSFLAKMKSELAILHVLPWGKTLLRIEEQMLNAFTNGENLEAIYDCAYLLIDLSKSYLPYASVINSAILAGLCFQYAASKETQASKAMAAERIALCLYQIAMSTVYRAGAPVALYASTHIAKYVSELVYDQSTLERKKDAQLLFQPGDMRIYAHGGSVVETIEGAIQKSLYLLDMFPFYTSPKSTFDLEVIGLFQLGIIRDLLQSLLSEKHLSPDHDRTKIIYELYQNAVEKWCETQIEQNERWEEEIKLKLLAIELLLEKDNSNCDEMERLIDQPYIHMQRDYEGFLQVNGELCLPDEKNVKIYKSFDGFEIDGETGNINLLLKEWHEGDSPSLRLFTDYDIVQMISLGIDGGALSLDHVDPHKKFHPLQIVRYAPSQLKDTEYLKTLFMTDYLLKMFSIGAEISADSPYLIRRIDNLLASLPEHLRKLLKSYSDKTHRTPHRLWITTESIECQYMQIGERITVCYGDVKTIVKTHPLEFDFEGKLVDTEDDPDDNSPEARFARSITQNYREIGSYFPEFLRLEQLVKISGAISQLKQFRQLNKHNNALEQELKTMQLSDEPVKYESLDTTTTLRVPAIRCEVIDRATEELYHVYGGVDAYPKFTNKKVSGSRPDFFKTPQERTAVRAKEIIVNYRNKENSKSDNHSTNNNKTPNPSPNNRFEPIRSNPCSTSSFIKAALKGGYEAMDMQGQIPHGAPTISKKVATQLEKSGSYFGGGRGRSDEYPGAEKTGTYLGGMAIGLYEQWKMCRESKKQQASATTNNNNRPKPAQETLKGLGGIECTRHDVLKAANAVNNLDEKYGIATQIVNGLRTDIKWGCAPEHIQDPKNAQGDIPKLKK